MSLMFFLYVVAVFSKIITSFKTFFLIFCFIILIFIIVYSILILEHLCF